MKRLLLPLLSLFILFPEIGWATQTHSGPEGLVIHQVAHLFFLFSMGILVFWLRERELTIKSGWRFIQYAAILLIIWNLDAFTVHILDESTNILQLERLDNWRIRIIAARGYESFGILYYLVKLDHLWCVPALFFLYMGLKRLALESGSGNSRTKSS